MVIGNYKFRDKNMTKTASQKPTIDVRMVRLRDAMKAAGENGYIVPNTDMYNNEYVPESDQRLTWLTDFTGSAGTAVVLEKPHAAFFTDSRYTIQAQNQVHKVFFKVLNSVKAKDEDPAPMPHFITENAAAGSVIGYDPRLMSVHQAQSLSDDLAAHGITLKAVEQNLIDPLWTNKPAAPQSKVTLFDDKIAGRSAAEKCKIVADIVNKDGCDAALITMTDSVAWLLNVRGGDVPFTPLALSFAILYADASAELFIDGRKLAPGTADHLGGDVKTLEPDAFGPALDRLGKDAKTVRVSADTAPLWVFDRLEKAGAVIDRGDDPCQLPKAIKTAVQIDGIRTAHRRDGASLTRFLAWLDGEAAKGSLMESACADKLESLRRGNDHFQGLSFPTISSAGANGAIVHYRVSEETDAPLRPKSLYLVDSGAQYLDGTTDVTRTIAIGEPTDEMRRNFTLVLKGHIALATARFPEGTTGSQLDTLARLPLWRAGLDYDHGTGHGVGHFLGVHEGPQRISKRPNRVALEPGMVVSNEPGYYKAGAYERRIENLVTVIQVESDAENPLLGFETLTLTPIDQALVVADMLDGAEVAWLNAYHARVLNEITPLVDEATAEWLAEAAAPIS